MTYTDKVKKSEEILTAIHALKDGESISVTYGSNFNGEPKCYKILVYGRVGSGERSYSIWNSINGMNIESLGRTTMKAYTYDMMSQRTTYTFPLYEMEIVEESK